MRKLFTRVTVAAALLLRVAEAFAQSTNGTAPTAAAVPALGGFGLATLAGGLAMAGAWAMARARRKQ